MSVWWTNIVALSLVASFAIFLAVAIIARLGSWHIRPAASLMLDEGLRVGARAPQVAAHNGDLEYHLDFGGEHTFVVFGTADCGPCKELLHVAAWHPATRRLRKVYLGDSTELDVPPEVLARWEVYRLHDQDRARKQWRAPVSPYFFLVDAANRIAAKGVANQATHLDGLLNFAPSWMNVPHQAPAGLRPLKVRGRRE